MDLSRIAASLSDVPDEGDLPVDHWEPAHCGTMDLVICDDGTWQHEGRPITRAPLVRLLSRILRSDPDGYVLVTPAEKLAIRVEDVPFIVSDFDRLDGTFRVVTNVGDRVAIGPDHPLEMRPHGGSGVDVPYVRVRGKLWARFGRPAYYRLIEEVDMEADESPSLSSSGMRFSLGPRS